MPPAGTSSAGLPARDPFLREPFHVMCPGFGHQTFQSTLADARLRVLQQEQSRGLSVRLRWRPVCPRGLLARPADPDGHQREVAVLPGPGQEGVHVSVDAFQLGSCVCRGGGGGGGQKPGGRPKKNKKGDH
jgi:hypothetical protein